MQGAVRPRRGLPFARPGLRERPQGAAPGTLCPSWEPSAGHCPGHGTGGPPSGPRGSGWLSGRALPPPPCPCLQLPSSQTDTRSPGNTQPPLDTSVMSSMSTPAVAGVRTSFPLKAAHARPLRTWVCEAPVLHPPRTASSLREAPLTEAQSPWRDAGPVQTGDQRHVWGAVVLAPGTVGLRGAGPGTAGRPRMPPGRGQPPWPSAGRRWAPGGCLEGRLPAGRVLVGGRSHRWGAALARPLGVI